MKKNLVALLAVAVLTMTAATAAESTGPVSNWLNNVSSKVSKKEQAVNTKSQTEQQKLAAKKKANQDKIAKEKAKIQKKQADNEKKVQAKKNKASETKKNLKELFSVD